MNIFSFGNRKLPKHMAIFNISSATDCESNKKGLCQLINTNKCYALKAEKMYKQVIPYRNRQNKFWKKCTAEEFVEIFLKTKKNKNIKYLRINEAGDFITQKCVDKADKIAKLLSKYNIKVCCYTARKDLNFSKKVHLVVNGSGFMVDNEFRITYDKNNLNADRKNKIAVCIGDCNKCTLCTKSLGMTIKVKDH